MVRILARALYFTARKISLCLYNFSDRLSITFRFPPC